MFCPLGENREESGGEQGVADAPLLGCHEHWKVPYMSTAPVDVMRLEHHITVVLFCLGPEKQVLRSSIYYLPLATHCLLFSAC